MEDLQMIKWKIEALKRIRGTLKSCRARQIETLEKVQELLKLLPGPTKDRKTGESQKNETQRVEPGELEADLKGLKRIVDRGISLFWTGFISQKAFENELFKKMRTITFKLVKDLSDVEEIKKWPFMDRLRFAELVDKIMADDQNFILRSYALIQKMGNPDFMEKFGEALMDKSQGPVRKTG